MNNLISIHRKWLSPILLAALSVVFVSAYIQAAGSDQPASTATEELNTSLETAVVVPPGRPAWVEEAPVRNKSVDETAVCSEPFANRTACQTALDEKIQQAVTDYIAEQTGSQYAPKFISYDLTTIKERLVSGENYYEETIVSPSVGPMHQMHARVQFPESFRKEIADRWLQVRSAARLGQVGLGFVALLGFFSTIAGFFRADNATRGYYTGRLQFLAVGAILGMIVLGAVVARWIPWI